MAAILDLITVGAAQIILIDSDPTQSPGLSAPTGSIATIFDATGSDPGKLYVKTSNTDTGWSFVRAGLVDLSDPSQITGVTQIAHGGTGANTATQAVTNLGAVHLSGDTMTGALVLGAGATVPTGFTLTLTDVPSASTDAANKNYVDMLAAGLKVKGAVVAATTANLNATYSNGSSGVGATLTNAGTQAAFSVDGYNGQLNDLFLIKDQTSGLQNGIYQLTTVGSGSTNWVLTRKADNSGSVTTEVDSGTFVFVQQGTLQHDTGWTQTTDGTITLGTTSLSYVQFSGLGEVTAGHGLSKTFNTLNVVESALDINSIGGTPLHNANGGTGLDTSTAANGTLLIGNGTGLSLSTLTAGQDIVITNSSGNITIATTFDTTTTVATVNTTNNTQTLLATIPTTTDTVMLLKTKNVGRRTGGTSGAAGASGAVEKTLRVKNVGGTVTIVNQQTDYSSTDAPFAAGSWAFVVSGTNILLEVTGAANQNISWKSEISTNVI